MKSFLLFALMLFTSAGMPAQGGAVRGRIFNKINREPIAYATVSLPGTSFGAFSDSSGGFELRGIPPGLYNISVSHLGFKPLLVTDVEVGSARPVEMEFGLEEEAAELGTVEISSSPFVKTAESPVSLRSIGVNEIARNPGGNRDISRIIQSLPGVAGTVAFRNDIIIRGGAPNENRFFLDGIEVPNINHFSTQGASGGPVGLINVNLIREVDFYTSAFPAARGNAASSVMEIKQRAGREDRLGLNATIGSSDLGLTLEGPLGKRTTFIASARRSYLQWLFQALALPFLPNYNDFQFKTRTKVGAKDELVVLGLGAIDAFALNLAADSTREQQYILGNLPVNTQWNYTVGAHYRHFFANSFLSIVSSRNMLNNRSYKYADNDAQDPAGKILDYDSQEIENHLRLEHNIRVGAYQIIYGVAYSYARYLNSTFNRIAAPGGLDTVQFSSALDIHKYGAFASINRKFGAAQRLSLALGVRFDGNTYSRDMSNPLTQYSPRLALSYAVTPRLNANFSTGIYHQLPPYTTMGYRAAAGSLVNRTNGLRYIRSTHLVGGLDYITDFNCKFSAEGFYKAYDHYPFLVRDSVSLANLGGDFGVIGNEPATPSSEGRSYGLELLAQQKLYKGFFGILAYTWVRSEFTDGTGRLRPSAWDNRHIVSTTLGKKFKRNWEVGFRWRLYGGTPYTPYDRDRSASIATWNVTGRGLPDYSRLNTLRLRPAHNLDVRVDKRWYFEKWSLNLYVDVQNAYNFQAQGVPYLDTVRDGDGNPVVDPSRPDRYLLEEIPNALGTLLPSVGIVIDL